MRHALMTDRYEFSMLQTFIAEGIHEKRAVFEVFSRKLQPGFRFGVFAGLNRLLPMIENFEFGGSVLRFLRENKIVDKPTYDYLSEFRFNGKITAYREGDLYFPNSPVLTVEGTLGECILLETLILSVLNFDSAIAGRAARIRQAAGDRRLIEMGSRRVNEESAVVAARAAYIAGFDSTSNLLAGMEYGIPTSGTAAHAFTLAHEHEIDAFGWQMMTHGPETTLLVDTYNIKKGVQTAIEAWDILAAEKGEDDQLADLPPIGAVRIDSGDLAAEAYKVREQLDEAGFNSTNIVATSDLDEYVIKDLLGQGAPIDAFGVGTKLVSTPPSGFVYKLVAIEQDSLHVRRADGMDLCEYDDEDWPCKKAGEKKMRPVAKKAKDKVSVGGKKYAVRHYDRNGFLIEETYSTDPDTPHEDGDVYPQRIVMEKGRSTVMVAANDPHGIEAARSFHAQAMQSLPKSEQSVWYGDHGPYLTVQEA